MLTRPRLLLRDSDWRQMEPYTAGRRCDRGATGKDTRRFVEGVFWILRTGAPWRDLPAWFGRWNSIYRRFLRWSYGGIWARVMRVFNHTRGRGNGVGFLDSTSIRVHQHAAANRSTRKTRRMGRSRGGMTSKLHAVVTTDWRLVAHCLTPGQASDVSSAPRLLRRIGRHCSVLVADRAYDSDAWIGALQEHGVRAVIPPRRHRRCQRAYSHQLYGLRHRVENYFARLKHMRRMATRYEKRCVSWQGFFCAAHTLICLGVRV
jgi:transposase